MLVWPVAYPILIKGLLEQNGAYILDALDNWPKCGSFEDDKDIKCTILSPIYYLLWQQPPEPFEQCFFQHLADYDDKHANYVKQALAHLHERVEGSESIIELLFSRLLHYVALQPQLDAVTEFPIVTLIKHLRLFKTLQLFLEQGLLLSHDDIFALWDDDDFRDIILPFIKVGQVQNKQALADEIQVCLSQGEDYFELYAALTDGEPDLEILETALLNHITSDEPRQPVCMRFIEQGATGNKCDSSAVNVIMHAAKLGFANVLEALISRDNVNVIDQAGNTVMHHAVLSGNQQCVIISLKAGVDFEKKNKQHKTAYGLARDAENKTLLTLLENKFGIRELSEDDQMKRVLYVHAIHAFLLFMIPLQLFIVFSETLAAKSEFCFGLTIVSLGLFFVALTLKRSPLYPNIKHPISFSILRWLSPVSLLLQLGLSLIVIINVLS